MNNIENYIENLNISDVPWNRMVAAYGTAEKYPEFFNALDAMQNIDEMDKVLNDVSDFEHQGTLFSPAPFALVFLLRIYEKARHINTPEAEWLVNELNKSFDYYLEICQDADKIKHAEPFPEFTDMLDEQYLLPEDYTEDDLDEFYENFMPDDEYFYSLYYYSGIILKDYDKKIQ